MCDGNARDVYMFSTWVVEAEEGLKRAEAKGDASYVINKDN